ncbi:MAG: hypothetical protein KDB00_29055 [Planctomycetales bacterium]|nr:hypothetical protein [Planctomycetales bacterium]
MRFFSSMSMMLAPLLLLLVPLCCGVQHCIAQQPLPDLEPNLISADLLQVNASGSVDDAVTFCDEVPEPELTPYKNQFLQNVSLSGGYTGDVGGSGFSGSYVDVAISTGIPLGSMENILGIRPRVRVDWIDADPAIDVPGELYDFELLFFNRYTLTDRLSTTAVVSPSLRSDLTTSDHATRLFALGLLNWQWIPDRLTLSGGGVYLGRADIAFLPVVGMLWSPSRVTKLDLRFPTSKLSHRIAKDGGRSETWGFLSAGLGGNTWSITRSNAAPDEISLREYNMRLGIERIVDGGGGCFADVGYAFGRQLEYSSDESVVKLDDAILFRCGWSY